MKKHVEILEMHGIEVDLLSNTARMTTSAEVSSILAVKEESTCVTKITEREYLNGEPESKRSTE